MNRLKQCRLDSGLSQQYVAIMLGVKGPSVSNWERGKTNPTAENLMALAKLYGVSVDYLIGADERATEKDQDQELSAMLAKLRQLPTDKLDQVLEYASFLAKKK